MALAPRDIVFAVVAALVAGGIWNLIDRIVAGVVALHMGTAS